MLTKYNMQECKSAKTPMTVDFQKSETESKEFENQEIYQSAIGSLIYLANWTRPDIVAVVNILSRHVSKPM